jgi:hypothetical protein
MAIRIHITDTLIHIGTVPVGIGTTDIGRIIHAHSAERDSIATGVKSGQYQSSAGGCKSRRLYFFGDVEAAGAAADVPDGDGSENSFFNLSWIPGSSC